MEARDMKKDCQTAKWGEAGVTLIEAVIALTILAVMGVIALEAMRLGYRTWEKTERRADADQRLRVMHDLLVHEFSRLEPVTTKIETHRVTAFRGFPDKLVFYGAPDMFAAQPYAGLVRRVSMQVEPGRGLVVGEGWPLVDGQSGFEAGTASRVLDPRVIAVRFRYLAPPSKDIEAPHWIEEWEPVERQMNRLATPGVRASNSVLLPSAVELTLVMQEEQIAREHRFVFPIRIGRYLL